MKLVALVLLLLSFLAGARVEAAAGDNCGQSTPCDPTTLVCDTDGKCKANAGQPCSSAIACVTGSTCSSSTAASGTCQANAGKPCSSAIACVTGSTCSSSTTASGTCLTNGALGGACLTGSTCTAATDTCDATASRCRRLIGQACTTGSTTECVSTADTCPSGTGPVCTCPTGKTASTDKKTCSGAASVIASLALLLASVVTSRYL